MSGRIVVGVDGSDESIAALRWAVEEAQCKGATLEVVTVWGFPHSAMLNMPGETIPSNLGEELEQGAKEVQEDAIRRVISQDGAVRVETRVVEGVATWSLLAAANGADLLVVGSRGLGGFRELLLGSVSQQCAHHASCPVVIVHPARDRAA